MLDATQDAENARNAPGDQGDPETHSDSGTQGDRPADPESRFRTEGHRWARWSGLVVGLVVGWQFLTMENDDIAGPISWALTAFGLCAVGGVLLGDALAPRPRDAVRTASLTPRRIRDHVPPRVAPLLVIQAASLVVLLATGAATATADQLGRPGRALAVTCDGIRTVVGPWPGLFYSVPMLVALVVGTPACFWALRRVAHGPGDDQQRHDRAWAITGAWGLMVSSQLVLVVLMIAVMLMDTTCAGPLGTVSVLVLYLLGFVSLFTAAWSLSTVVVPRAVADEPTPKADENEAEPATAEDEQAAAEEPGPEQTDDTNTPTDDKAQSDDEAQSGDDARTDDKERSGDEERSEDDGRTSRGDGRADDGE